MLPINRKQILTLRKAKQNFCDCYLVSSINALTRCKNGRKFLSQNIQRSGDNFCIRFNNVNGHPETYLVKQPECDELILRDKYLEPLELTVDNHPIIKAVEVAMNKLLKLHPDKKPFVCNIVDCQEKFEFNKVSNFLKMFTGIRPITINESGISYTMRKEADIARRMFSEISQREGSFVIGTGFSLNPLKDLPHCYTVTSIRNGIINLYDCRRQTTNTKTYDEAISDMKYICGYFDNLLD